MIAAVIAATKSTRDMTPLPRNKAQTSKADDNGGKVLRSGAFAGHEKDVDGQFSVAKRAID
jgi:hypothetical protein